MKWVENIAENHSVEFVVLTILLLILGFVRQSEYSRIALFLRSFNNSSLVSQQVREEKAFNRIAIPIFFLVVFIMAFFFGKVLLHFNLFEDWSFLTMFFALCALIAILAGIRAAIYFSLSKLFRLNYIHRVHTFHWLLNNFILALIILSINILYTFGPETISNSLIYMGLLGMIVFYLARAVKIFTLFLTEGRIPLFYNVLYLCALEFLPPVLVITAVFRVG